MIEAWFDHSRQALTVVRVQRDQHGDPVGDPFEHVIDGCLGWPVSSPEDTDANRVTTQWNYSIPAGADVVASDRVRRSTDPVPPSGAPLRARAPWQVVGDPAPWPRGTVITIERV